MYLKCLLLVLSLISEVCSECVFSRSPTPMCFTLQDVARGANAQWNDLSIINNGHNPYYVNLPRNSFVKARNIKRILIKATINKIDRGAFSGLKLERLTFEKNNLAGYSQNIFNHVEVNKLYFITNNLQILTPNMFLNTIGLEDIIIERDALPDVPYNVFNGLDIRKIELNNCKLQFVEHGAFYNMHYLQHLSLNGNRLNKFDTTDIFEVSITMRYLYLNYNNISVITKDMFQGVPRLSCLYLGNNQIETIENGAFSHVKYLRDLCLTGNRLKEINPDMFFSVTTRLEVLNLSYNNLTFLANSVLTKLQSLKEISIVGNPWQCPCWQKLRNWMAYLNIKQLWCAYEGFSSGQYPTCVAHSPLNELCYDDTLYTDEYNKIYYDALASYEFLPQCLFVYSYQKQPELQDLFN